MRTTCRTGVGLAVLAFACLLTGDGLQAVPPEKPQSQTPPVQTDAAGPPPAGHVYQTIGERKLQLAMHYPPGWKADDRRAAILFFSGSHKVKPDKDGKLPPLAAERAQLGLPVVNRGPGGEHHVPLCDGLAQRGFVVLRVEYRTRGKDGVLPGEDIADAVSAMRWVRGHAPTLGIDPRRIAAAGGSSGGYLAASLFAFEERYPASGDRKISARPDAILLYSPLVDWLEVGIMSKMFLVVLNGDKELGAKVSPARHWRKDCPPTLVMVGSEEPPFQTVKEFAEKWKAAGAPMELFVAKDEQHGFFGKAAWRDKTIALSEEFLKARGFFDAPAAPKKKEAKPVPDTATKSTTPPASFIYRTFGERKLQLVMHYPPGWKATDRRPVLLCFEGGSLNPNDKSGKPYPLAAERAKLGLPVVNNGPSQAFAATAEHFAQRGLVCVRVEYRKRKDDGSMPPDSLADAASAVRWVRVHAGELGVDPARVIACGSSGGGHVAASLAALKEFDAADDDQKVSRRPNALILHSPLLDFLEGGTSKTPFLAAVNNDRALGERLSPARHWSKDQPPTLLFTGEKEPVFQMLCDFAKKWKDAGQPIELVPVAGGHVSSLNEKFIADTLPRMEAFLKGIGFLDAKAAKEPPVPLTTLGKDKYRGFVGGLYAEGRNEPWGAHAEALTRMNGQVQPLDRDGKPDPNGKLVVAGVGASVCKQIFAALEKQAADWPGLHPNVVVVNCAVGGQDVNKIADASGAYWKQVEKALAARGVSPAQVQVVWYQSDDLRDQRDDFPGRPQRLQEAFAKQLRLLKQHFPNVRLCYFSGRHTTAFMPEKDAMAKHGEPRPYHNGWAVKWLIEEQTGGKAELRFEGKEATVPLAAWATYFWTDGDKKRADGYRWTCADVVADGVHLSEAGQRRVAGELLRFFATDPFTKRWFSRVDAKPPAKPADPAAPEKPVPEQPAWIINGTDKLPKLKRLLGTTENVRVVMRDLKGKQVAEVRDVCNRRTDLNKLVGPGEYRVEFLDKDGKPIKLTQEVGEVLRLK